MNLQFSRGKTPSDLFDLRLGQLGAPDSLPPGNQFRMPSSPIIIATRPTLWIESGAIRIARSGTPLTRHVRHILFMRPEKKMRWIATELVVTTMADK